jgi:flagellin
MAINDISLTAGMRSNLLSLQSTVSLLERTQSRLSTGNKVNSALDNPTSYFAAQVLNSRASKIDGLKDAMGQAIQTVKAADQGITAITSLIEQAKGVAQSAQSAASSTTGAVSLTLASVNGGTASTVTLTITAGMTFGDTVVVGGVTFTATSAASSGTSFQVTGTLATTANATSIAGAIAAYTNLSMYTPTTSGAVITFAGHDTANDPVNVIASQVVASAHGTVTLVASTAGETVVIGGVTLTAAYNAATAAASAGTQFYVGNATNPQSDTLDATALAAAINANNTLTTAGYTATSALGVVSIQKTVNSVPNAISTTDITGTHADITAANIAGPSAELKSLQDQYNVMRSQITALAEDSGYKGKNLLSANSDSRSLTVQFETSSLTVTGFDSTAAALGITTATWATTPIVASKLSTDIAALDAALTTMRSNASTLSGNLSIITVRQNFSTSMINTLTEGSNKLTLADTNEEGANMLMLQTRQSLGTTALSLSAQAAQAVLRLFQ